jgi:hypothetical protein
MAEIVNLNRARKARAKQDAQARASANRARFGRTKADKLRDKAEAERLAKRLDDSQREP